MFAWVQTFNRPNRTPKDSHKDSPKELEDASRTSYNLEKSPNFRQVDGTLTTECYYSSGGTSARFTLAECNHSYAISGADSTQRLS